MEKVLQEVAVAYADCGAKFDGLNRDEWHKLMEPAMKARNLGFRASEGVDPATAVKIMEECCPGYNGFSAELLAKFPSDCKIFLAREGSVCIYVQKGEQELPSGQDVEADEYNVEKKTKHGIGMYSASREGYADGVKTDYGGFKGEHRYWWD